MIPPWSMLQQHQKQPNWISPSVSSVIKINGSMISSWSCKVSIPLLHTCWANQHLTGILRLPSWQGCIYRSWLRLSHLGNRDYVTLQHSNSPTWTKLTLNCKLPYSGTWLWELFLQTSVVLLHNMRFIYPILLLVILALQTRLYRW